VLIAFHHAGTGLPIQPGDVDAIHARPRLDRETVVLIEKGRKPFDLPAEVVVLSLERAFELLELFFDVLDGVPDTGLPNDLFDLLIRFDLFLRQERTQLTALGAQFPEDALEVVFFVFVAHPFTP
jgi:hypothetical protein